MTPYSLFVCLLRVATPHLTTNMTCMIGQLKSGYVSLRLNSRCSAVGDLRNH